MSSTSESDARLRHQDSVLIEQVDDDTCLFRAGTNDVAVLNRTAGDIWELIDGQSSPTQIASLLATAYEVPITEVLPHVHQVLDHLISRGFLVS